MLLILHSYIKLVLRVLDNLGLMVSWVKPSLSLTQCIVFTGAVLDSTPITLPFWQGEYSLGHWKALKATTVAGLHRSQIGNCTVDQLMSNIYT